MKILKCKKCTKVVHCKKEPFDILIDRTTKYGNPFRIGRNGTREEVIEKFRRKAWNDPEFIKMVRRDLTGKTLACWCRPLPCHGDVYIEICDGTENEYCENSKM